MSNSSSKPGDQDFKVEKTQSFRTKIILITFLSILVGLVFSVTVSVIAINKLSDDASIEVAKGLKNANLKYLNNYIDLTAQRIIFNMNATLQNGYVLQDVMQRIINNKELEHLQDIIYKVPYFMNPLSYTKGEMDKKTDRSTGNWWQSDVNKPTVVSVWGYLLDDNNKVRKNVVEDIKKTAILDLFMPSLLNSGQGQWLYYVGNKHSSYVRRSPSVNMADNFDALYPGHNELNYWDFFFPTLVESWEKMSSAEKKSLLVTATPPYEDAAGSGFITSFLYPLWEGDKFSGAIGLDFNLKHIIKYVQDVQLASSGFAFIANQDGSILGINDHGSEVMGLNDANVGKINSWNGGKNLDRNLRRSEVPAFANLKFPADEEISYTETEEEKSNGKKYIIVQKKILPLSYYRKGSLDTESMILAFVVPKDEIYASLHATQNKIEQSKNEVLIRNVAVVLITLLFVFIATLKFSGNMTRGITALMAGVQKIQRKEYDVKVEKFSNDEIGHLSVTFNSMASQIKGYTHKLERLVQFRTQELEDAYKEISKVYELLEIENTRLSEELNVAQTLQTMVLPKEAELKYSKVYDISAYMKPAEEVGGDYYDVLPEEQSSIKVGIGDVTGHGLESGVIMLMVQTAVRSLTFAGVRQPSEFYSIINKVLYHNIQRIRSDKSITLSLLDLQPEGGVKITGQHEDIIVVKANGESQIIDTMDLGLPIGLLSDIEESAKDIEIHLDDGDVLLLHTDGITEAENAEKEHFGLEKLSELAVKYRDLSADEIKENIINDLADYMGEVEPDDDITIVVIKKNVGQG